MQARSGARIAESLPEFCRGLNRGATGSLSLLYCPVSAPVGHRPGGNRRARSSELTRKQLVVIVAVVLAAAILSALVAYRQGLRRGKSGPLPAAATTGAEDAPCVDFAAASPLVGKTGCVTGRILRVYTSRNGNTFLDFCADYRSCPFTSVVFSEDRAKFGDLGALKGRRVELRGLVTEYQGRAEIIIRDQEQIRMAP